MAQALSISNVYDHHTRSFRKLLKKAGGLSEKPIHQLRVEIKNLRVFYSLLERLSGHKIKTHKLLSMLRPVFGLAGDIRSCQINSELTSQYKTKFALKFRLHLKEKKARAGKALKVSLKDFDLEKFIQHEKKLDKTLSKLGNRQVKSVSESRFRTLRAQVREEMFEMHRDEALHEIRKKLKMMKNIIKLVDEIEPGNKLKTAFRKLDHTYELIGGWHDRAMLLEELDHFLKKHPPDTSKGLAFLLKLRERNEKEKTVIARRLKAEIV